MKIHSEFSISHFCHSDSFLIAHVQAIPLKEISSKIIVINFFIVPIFSLQVTFLGYGFAAWFGTKFSKNSPRGHGCIVFPKEKLRNSELQSMLPGVFYSNFIVTIK